MVSRWVFVRGLRAWVVLAAASLCLWSLSPTVAEAAGRQPAAKAPAAKKPAPKKQAVRAAATKKSPAASARKPAAGKASAKLRDKAARRAVVVAPPVLSVGQLAGLHAAPDPLDLKSSVALVVDQDTNQVLLSKNSDAVLPIASITKLMTALVVVEAGLSMDETVSIGPEDVEATSSTRSRLLPGTQMSRGEMMRLSLMSSENRAANALSRHYPGGAVAFVDAMNRKARQLGLDDTRFVEPTGLSSDNRSSARDLAVLVNAAGQHQLIRELSTARDAQVAVGARQVQFHTTNGLLANPNWEILLQKTGYIAAAGRCLVMQAELAGRRLTMVLLDSAGKYSRIGDAERIRQWLASSGLIERRDAAAVPNLH